MKALKNFLPFTYSASPTREGESLEDESKLFSDDNETWKPNHMNFLKKGWSLEESKRIRLWIYDNNQLEY